MNMNALLITQYERYGSVGMDEYIENYIHEELDITIDMLSDYNDYLFENNDYDDLIYSDIEEMLQGYSTMEIIKVTHFGNFNFSDDFYVFNGYGNIDSYTDTEIIKIMSDNNDFLRWYIEKYELIDENQAQIDIDAANELIRKGY